MTTTRPRFSTTALALALALPASAAVRGNPIDSGFSLSASEARRPILLDETGARITVLKGPNGATRTLPRNASPTYVAYRLDKPFELPASYPTINVGGATPHSGPVRGPLRLDTLAKAALDAELAQTGGVAAVHLPRQTYLVESIAAIVGSTSDSSTQTWIASNAGVAVATPAPAGKPSVGDTLKSWYDTSTSAVAKLNQQIADAVKSRFTLKAPKPVIYPAPTKSTPVTAAQMLTPPTAAQGMIQPAPVPEPASLLVFAAAATVAGLRLRAGRKPRV